MENFFQIHMTKREIDAFSNLGLAHLGDCVYELLCRTYLCTRGEHTVKRLHKDAVALVTAPKQAQFAEKILPHLTEEESSYYRRGKTLIPTRHLNRPRLRNTPRPPGWKRFSVLCIWLAKLTV